MNFDLSAVTHSTEQTEELGKAVATVMLDDPSLPRFVALFGDLGVGKTAFVRGFTQAIAPSARVKSPTFALVNEYIGGRLSVYHFDMFRINSWDDLYSSGWFDYIEQGGVMVAEWSENIEEALPDDAITIEISRIDDEKREILVRKAGN